MSRQFTDTAGHTWTLKLDVWTVKRVRDMAGVDLLDLGDAEAPPKEQLLFKLVADPVLLVDVLYVILKPAAEAAGVSDEDFGRAMAGDTIDQATKALLGEIADFIPNPRDRARARKVIAGTWELIDKAQDLLDQRVDVELPKIIAEAVAILGNSSTSSPGESG